jgi:hypothetical protein
MTQFLGRAALVTGAARGTDMILNDRLPGLSPGGITAGSRPGPASTQRWEHGQAFPKQSKSGVAIRQQEQSGADQLAGVSQMTIKPGVGTKPLPATSVE